MRITQELAQC